MKEAICSRCRRVFTMGKDGIVIKGESVCDICGGVIRSPGGYALETGRVRRSLLTVMERWLKKFTEGR